MNEMTEQKKVLFLVFSAVILGTSFVFLFFDRGIGINFPIYFFLIVAFALLLSRVFLRPFTWSHYGVISLGMFFALMVFVRSSELLTFFNVVGSLTLLLVAIMLFAKGKLRSLVLGDYLRTLFLPLRFIQPLFETISEIITLKYISQKNAKIKELIRGSVMAAIALVVFASLLASADAQFEKLISAVFTFSFDEELVPRIIFGTIVTLFFIGGFSFTFKKIKNQSASVASISTQNLGAIETIILLCAINLLFFIFIFFQLSVFFGGTTHLLVEGLTYAEYAREGFFQLVVVAVLSLLVIFFSERQIARRDGVHFRPFVILSVLLILHVIAILISAFVRLTLYEEAYGFTTLRLYSHALMIWVGVVLISLSLHIVKSGKYVDFSFRVFCSIVTVLFLFNMINPDAFIARKNLERYTQTGLIDAYYLGTLSRDALFVTAPLLHDKNDEVRNTFIRGLYQKIYGECAYEECQSTAKASWQSYRYKQTTKEGLLKEYYAMILARGPTISSE